MDFFFMNICEDDMKMMKKLRELDEKKKKKVTS